MSLRRALQRTGATAVVSILLAGGCSLVRPTFADSMRDKPAPDFALEDLQGKTVRLSELRDKPVVLAFFAYG